MSALAIFFSYEYSQPPENSNEEVIAKNSDEPRNFNPELQVDIFTEDSSSSTQQASVRAANNFLEELQQSIEREYSSLDLAQISFDKNWANFVSSSNLPSEGKFQIRELLIQKDAQDFEIAQLLVDGNISDQDLIEYFTDNNRFEDRISEILSPAQMEDYWENRSDIEERLETETARIIEDQIQNRNSDILFFTEIGDLDTVLAYIASGADVNSRPLDGSTSPLHNAIAAKDAQMVNALIESGADVNWPTENRNQTPLELAAMVGSPEMIHDLVSSGANVNWSRPGFSEFTPLVGAALNNRTEAVAELLSLGADATGGAGVEALHFSIWHRNSDMEYLLIRAGANGNDPAVVSTRNSVLEPPRRTPMR